MSLDSHPTIISRLNRFARCCTIYKSPVNFYHRVTDITSFVKHLRIFQIILWPFIKIWCYTFSRICNKNNPHPVLYGDLVYKHSKVRGSTNVIASGTKIVKRLRRRQCDPGIIEKTIGLVHGPSSAICRLFLKHYTLTNQAGTTWRAFSKPPQRW